MIEQWHARQEVECIVDEYEHCSPVPFFCHGSWGSVTDSSLRVYAKGSMCACEGHIYN